MTKVSFYLKEPTSTKETVLFSFIYLKRTESFKISTGVKLLPIHWNKEKQVVKRTYPHYVQLNELLKQLRAEYESLCFNAMLQNRPVTKEYLQAKNRFASSTQTSKDFFEAYDAFLNSKRNVCAPKSQQKYQTIKNQLEEFAKKGYNLNFDNINFAFYEQFCAYLLYDRNMFNHSVSKTIKFVKTFLNFAFERGYHSNLEYKKFKPLQDNSSEIIALSMDELKAIESLEGLPGHLRKARDLFLILCYTSLRFSDLSKLNGINFIEGSLNITAQKTKQFLAVIEHPRLTKILEPYILNGVISLPEMANQKVNAYLKEIGQLANLDTNITKVRIKGGQAYEKPLKKWQLLTTHTGRRTFTTLSLVNGMDSEAVKKITGHKNDASFKKYVRYADNQLKDKVLEAWK